MSLVSSVLVQQVHLDIFGVVRKTNVDLKGWVANQNYFLDVDLVPNNFFVRASDKDYLKAALANDCNRMAMAAIESISGVQLDYRLGKSGAWGVIRAYYASFFAIHSIMRMFGISCSQLEQVHVDKIYEFASVVGRSGSVNKLEKGFYSIRISKSFSEVEFRKYKDSHRDTWGEFLGLLERLIDQSENVVALVKYKSEMIDILMSIKRGITRSRCSEKGNWLSNLRNSVNYQHTHGVWFPYERRQVAPEYIATMANDWLNPVGMLDTRLNRDDIELFFEVVIAINALFRELLVSCSEKVGGGNKVFGNGSLKLLKTLRAL